MKKQWLAMIERALRSDQDLFPLNQTWAALHREYNIGLTQANKLKLSPKDKQELRLLVKEIDKIDLAEHSLTEFADMDREQALSIVIDEKLAGKAVKKHRLAIKTLPGKMLLINNQSYWLPACGHLDLAIENISGTKHRCILIIENYRCFDRLAAIKLNVPEAFAEPLVVFRGDNVYSEQTVRQLIQKLQLPVLMMADLDPNGLQIAQSYPKFAGLLTPNLAVLETLFKDQNKANRQLYEKQLAGCQNALSNTHYPVIAACWELMKIHQAGIVQEHWLAGDIELILHSI